MSTGQASSSSRRRRSIPRGRRSVIYVPLLRHRQTGRFILVLMSLLAIFYVGMRLWELRQSALLYGGMLINATRADMRYFAGPPRLIAGPDGKPVKASGAAAETAEEWIYEDGSARRRIRFGANDRVILASCSDSLGNSYGCPRTAGLGIGSLESDVWYKLGVPSRQTYAGDVKIIGYDDLGLEFALRRVQVARIALRQRGSRFGYLVRLPVVLLP